ncbi:hypothetical protein F5Y15DRAFT_273902 [Xylariaceae sp. FL0016]|nr:hypothetical protein F5Y15DRAFT_273902 [Xylariaceae sp. FL0016]
MVFPPTCNTDQEFPGADYDSSGFGSTGGKANGDIVPSCDNAHESIADLMAMRDLEISTSQCHQRETDESKDCLVSAKGELLSDPLEKHSCASCRYRPAPKREYAIGTGVHGITQVASRGGLRASVGDIVDTGCSQMKMAHTQTAANSDRSSTSASHTSAAFPNSLRSPVSRFSSEYVTSASSQPSYEESLPSPDCYHGKSDVGIFEDTYQHKQWVQSTLDWDNNDWVWSGDESEEEKDDYWTWDMPAQKFIHVDEENGERVYFPDELA